MLYTIGHSNHQIDFFLYLLKKYNIQYVIDVRTSPFCKYTKQYDRWNIEKTLKENNIIYCFMGEFFGAKRKEKELYTAEGYLDFEKTTESEKFLLGFNNILKGLQDDYNVALMCSEKDPKDCHRSIMISKKFLEAGFEANHILPDGKIKTQKELEKELVNEFYSGRKQLNLFTMNMTEEDYIRESYKKQNEKIGYRIKKK